jgi:hypothetical protein
MEKLGSPLMDASTIQLTKATSSSYLGVTNKK